MLRQFSCLKNVHLYFINIQTHFKKILKKWEHLGSQDPQQRFLLNLEMGEIIMKKRTQQNAH